MKNTIVLAAVAGIASAAAAQSGGLVIVPSVSTIDSTVSTSFTLAVYASADFGTHVFGGAFGMANSGDNGIVTGMDMTLATWGAFGGNDFGHAGDGNHDGIRFGQFFIPGLTPPLAESSLANGDVLIGNFSITIAAGSEGTLDWSSTTDTAAGFLLEIYDEATFGTTQLGGSHGTAQVNVVPAPSAMALLGLGGLVAGRRRR